MNGSLVISKTYDIRKAHLQYMVKTLNISDGPTQDYEYALKNAAVGATFHLKRHIYPYIRYVLADSGFFFRLLVSRWRGGQALPQGDKSEGTDGMS